jgi:hypothetical protein
MTDDPEQYREPHEDYPEGKPCEEIPDDPGLNQETLHGSGFDEHRSLPELARLWLAELAEVGLHQPAPDRVWPPKMGEPKNHVIAPPEGDLRPLRLGDHRQVFWIRHDRPTGLRVPGQLDLGDDQPTRGFDSHEVGVAVAQRHLLAQDHEPGVAGQGQNLRRLLDKIVEGLLVGKARRRQQAPPRPVALPDRRHATTSSIPFNQPQALPIHSAAPKGGGCGGIVCH